MSIIANLLSRGNRAHGGNPVNVESDYGALAVDVSGPITPLDSDQFVTTGATNGNLRVRFVGQNGYSAVHEDSELVQSSVPLTGGTVYKWLDVINTVKGGTALTQFPDEVIGVIFECDVDLLYILRSAAAEKQTAANVRAAGFKWAASTQFIRGRVG